MNIFQNLDIDIQDFSINDFAELLTKHCGEQWERACDSEKDTRSLGELAICFKRVEDDSGKSAELTLFEKKPGTLYVPNIIPIGLSKFGAAEYNEILNNFVELVLKPAIDGTKVRYCLTRDKISLEDVVGMDTAKLLKKFSFFANKSTGSTHPSDQKLWFDFLVGVSKSRMELHTDLLEGTLLEQGWSEDRADKLAVEFEFAQALLNYAEGK
ncbi:MAG: hypothetical protein GY862_14405 [Gammaproteobacteria bacterium]|nr:hypothetical protein [Gammaproteobacteria bacterium]